MSLMAIKLLASGVPEEEAPRATPAAGRSGRGGDRELHPGVIVVDSHPALPAYDSAMSDWIDGIKDALEPASIRRWTAIRIVSKAGTRHQNAIRRYHQAPFLPTGTSTSTKSETPHPTLLFTQATLVPPTSTRYDAFSRYPVSRPHLSTRSPPTRSSPRSTCPATFGSPEDLHRIPPPTAPAGGDPATAVVTWSSIVHGDGDRDADDEERVDKLAEAEYPATEELFTTVNKEP
ncbi:hypothetical protein DL93DRAFT_2171203 [Clavulina sp. PMI_390]|nr:hypothetical protein DL93DRAFT_2171203 [Clavulina sp. PMI_390]